MKIKAMIPAALAISVLALAGCAGYTEANHYNAPPVNHTVIPKWIRIGTPHTYPTMMFGCFGTDGVFVANDNYTSAFVVKNDPHCGG